MATGFLLLGYWFVLLPIVVLCLFIRWAVREARAHHWRKLADKRELSYVEARTFEFWTKEDYGKLVEKKARQREEEEILRRIRDEVRERKSGGR